jgi:hypothetical protein
MNERTGKTSLHTSIEVNATDNERNIKSIIPSKSDSKQNFKRQVQLNPV